MNVFFVLVEKTISGGRGDVYESVEATSHEEAVKAATGHHIFEEAGPTDFHAVTDKGQERKYWRYKVPAGVNAISPALVPYRELCEHHDLNPDADCSKSAFARYAANASLFATLSAQDSNTLNIRK